MIAIGCSRRLRPTSGRSWTSPPGPDAREQQEVRRADRACAQDQLAPDLGLAARVAHAGGALAVEVDPQHLRVGDDRQVVAAAGRLEPGVRGGAAQALPLVHARDADAGEGLGPQVAGGGNARRLARFDERRRHRVGGALLRHRARLLLEVAQVALHRVPAPALGPGVEVRGVARDVHLRVHRRRAAQRLPARDVDAAAVRALPAASSRSPSRTSTSGASRRPPGCGSPSSAASARPPAAGRSCPDQR